MASLDAPIPLSDIESVLEWVDAFKLSRATKKINRDFSDAVLLAEILALHYPKLVEMHNYPPRNSHSLKLNNWMTLNRKVLKKLKLNLCCNTMEQLANCAPHVIERVLIMVRDKIHRDAEANKSKEDPNLSSGGSYYEALGEDEHILVVPVKTRVNGILETHQQKVVSHASYLALKEELKDAKESVDVMKQKVEHLDNLLKLKDERIEELQMQLERKQVRRKEAESLINSLCVPFETVPSPTVNERPLSVHSSVVNEKPLSLHSSIVNEKPLSVHGSIVNEKPLSVHGSIVNEKPLSVHGSIVNEKPLSVHGSIVNEKPLSVHGSIVNEKPLSLHSSIIVNDKPISVHSSSVKEKILSIHSSIVNEKPVSLHNAIVNEKSLSKANSQCNIPEEMPTAVEINDLPVLEKKATEVISAIVRLTPSSKSLKSKIPSKINLEMKDSKTSRISLTSKTSFKETKDTEKDPEKETYSMVYIDMDDNLERVKSNVFEEVENIEIYPQDADEFKDSVQEALTTIDDSIENEIKSISITKPMGYIGKIDLQ